MLVHALELSTAEFAERQGEIPAETWAELVRLNLVSRTRAIADTDAFETFYEEPERSWFELTLDGSQALFEAVGTCYDSGLCWSCGQWYTSVRFCPTCPACGFYDPDE